MADILEQTSLYRIRQIEIAEAEYYKQLIKILDKIENDIDAVEDEAQSLMDRTKSDARSMIEDANNRFNDKVSGMEGYVKRELTSLEEDLDRKLQKSLDNPLANR